MALSAGCTTWRYIPAEPDTVGLHGASPVYRFARSLHVADLASGHLVEVDIGNNFDVIVDARELGEAISRGVSTRARLGLFAAAEGGSAADLQLEGRVVRLEIVNDWGTSTTLDAEVEATLTEQPSGRTLWTKPFSAHVKSPRPSEGSVNLGLDEVRDKIVGAIVAQLVATEGLERRERPSPMPRPHPRLRAEVPLASPAAPAPESAAPPPSTPAARPGRGRTFVLVIGIDKYADPGIAALRFAAADARAVFSFYATDLRSPTDRDRVRLVSGPGATRTAVLRKIREHLVENATAAEDTAILYFAGHGFRDADEAYLACVDTRLDSLPETAISLTTLQSYWNRLGAGRRLFISDSCHSGALAGLRGIGGVAMAPSAGGAGRRVSVVIAASGSNQVSAEDEEAGHGVFTNVLLNGLRGGGDANRDGTITLGELSSYLTREVPRRAREVRGNQTPVIEHTPGAEATPLTRPLN